MCDDVRSVVVVAPLIRLLRLLLDEVEQYDW